MDDAEKKRGYRLVIQVGLSEEQFDDAWRYALKWKEEMEKSGYSWKGQTGGGYNSALKRHGYGYVIKSSPEDLLFRRVVATRRVFGIVKKSEVVRVKSGPHATEDDPASYFCPCPRCTSQEKWGWANGKPEMYAAFEFGETKGR